VQHREGGEHVAEVGLALGGSDPTLPFRPRQGVGDFDGEDIGCGDTPLGLKPRGFSTLPSSSYRLDELPVLWPVSWHLRRTSCEDTILDKVQSPENQAAVNEHRKVCGDIPSTTLQSHDDRTSAVFVASMFYAGKRFLPATANIEFSKNTDMISNRYSGVNRSLG
jgi:hypothetical protein